VGWRCPTLWNHGAVVIRRATVADADQLAGLVEQYRTFYTQEPHSRTKQYLVERLTNSESVVFVAEEDDTLVGFVQCYPTFSTVSLSEIWLLNDLFVDPKYRGRGIARVLMAEAERSAKESGATRIWLRTARDNVPARSLYEARGWVEDEVFARYDLIF
jgi:ribosomal protein S18 acetylase RimI-like enzyme